MILNETYYQTVWKKFENVKTLNVFNDNVSTLTMRIIINHYQQNQPIHINFQNSNDTLSKIGKNLFIELANDIYVNHYDLPTLARGNKLRDKRKYKDGKKHDHIIKNISNDTFLLEDTKNKAQTNLKYDDLVKNFIPIEQGIKQSTLQEYTNFFSDLNSGLKLDFSPTNFEEKSVFISKKSLWDCLPNRNKIPCTYLPNPREENNVSEIRSIPALHDCLVYFTPKYEICYQNLLLKNEIIKTIVVFDTEVDKIEQILQDKSRFGFNIIVISNNFSPVKNQAIPCWNWFKEEIEIVNAL